LYAFIQNRNMKEAALVFPSVKKIADNHDGIIYAEGDENKGSRFTLILPETH
jgi:signal transduction histidine kinase